MSDTIHLACVTCRVELWVGQGGYPPEPKGGRLYGNAEAAVAFEAFYQRHAGHDVRLTNLEGLYSLADKWREFLEDHVIGMAAEGRDYLGLAQMKLRHDTSSIPDSWGKARP